MQCTAQNNAKTNIELEVGRYKVLCRWGNIVWVRVALELNVQLLQGIALKFVPKRARVFNLWLSFGFVLKITFRNLIWLVCLS